MENVVKPCGLIDAAMITVLHSNVVSGKGPGSQLFRDNKRNTQRKRKREKDRKK